MLTIQWSRQALRDVRRLDRPLTRRIVDGIERYAADGHGDVKRLTGPDEEYRLRIGDWRVRFDIEHEAQAMRIIRVLPRGQAYR